MRRLMLVVMPSTGDGTGLGLEAARCIVREHGGEIPLESARGQTGFQVRLLIRS